MTTPSERPWASGPGELLAHGLDLLRKDTDRNRRLALISIDNSVELMIKVFLGLPRRVTGMKISRKEYQEFSESFPLLLDALETHASDRLTGADLGDIEWYHRLRNQLYHQGNGLTVERAKVEIYSELAKTLFTNLFGFSLAIPQSADTELLGTFLSSWIALEQASKRISLQNMNGRTRIHGRPGMPFLQALDLISAEQLAEFEALREIRNHIVHGQLSHQDTLTADLVGRLRRLTAAVERAAKGSGSDAAT